MFWAFFRFCEHQNWNFTLLIMNLAVADLAYCIISLPLNAAYYFTEDIILGHNACYLFAGTTIAKFIFL